jgi:hypothetical protein
VSGLSVEPDKAALSGASVRRLRFWVWFKERTHPTDLQITLFWAGIIGFGGAVCSVGFRFLTGAIHKLMTGSSAPGFAESFAHLSPGGVSSFPELAV